MSELIEKNRAAIIELCRRFHVARLDVFGSAATGDFDIKKSDADFLVEFEPLEPGQLANSYFGLLEELETLLARRVDLLTLKSIRNPYFLRAVIQTRTMLYAA